MPGKNRKSENNLEAKVGLYGWKLLRAEGLAAPKAAAYYLRHRATGARWLHLAADSKDNCFAVAFRTVPEDDTGAAHILEHTVLTGSERYPVRDPFFSMIRRSLQSFMNAFTSEDWTAYPFATANRKDFYNLLSVYLDAAFFPRLERLNFLQEGWRYEFEGGRLVRKGVVLSEMKGVLSTPERIMAERVKEALHPRGNYRFNSGGTPEGIPGLTHEALVAFHRRHYCPANAYFYSYGDLPLARHLAFLDRRLFARPLNIARPLRLLPEPRWSRPQRRLYRYPAKAGQAGHQVALAWRLAPNAKPLETISLSLLEEALMGNAAAPLRRALISSGLGSDLADGSGLNQECADAFFAIGLKDVAKPDLAKVPALVMRTLRRLAREGVGKDLAEGALNSLRFEKLEVANEPYPYGLKVWIGLVGPWLQGAEPIMNLKRTGEAVLNGRLAEPGRLTNLIKRCLLDNPHRVRVVLAPDPRLSAKKERRERAELAGLARNLTPRQKQQIGEDGRALRASQEAPQDPSVLPGLKLSDLDGRIEKDGLSAGRFPSALAGAGDTNGIVYFRAAWAADPADPDFGLWPFLAYALGKLPTSRRKMEELARLIEARTGGLEFQAEALPVVGRSGPLAAFSLEGKALAGRLDDLAGLARETVLETRFGDQALVRELLAQYRSQLESAVVTSGHLFALLLAGQNLSPAKALSERWHGLSQLFFLRRLEKAGTAGLSRGLSALAGRTLGSAPLLQALIGDPAVLEKTGKGAALFPPAPARPARSRPLARPARRRGKRPVAALAVTDVSYTALAVPAAGIRHPDSPALYVAAKHLSRGFIHREVREKGGAYGGFLRYNPLEELAAFGSYRDPSVRATLQAFDRAAAWLKRTGLTADSHEEAIIQAVADWEKPKTPAERLTGDFYRRLSGVTDRDRQAFKSRLLSVKPGDIVRAAGKYLSQPLKRGAAAVVTSRELLKKEKLGAKFEIREI